MLLQILLVLQADWPYLLLMKLSMNLALQMQPAATWVLTLVSHSTLGEPTGCARRT
jgi:hypothetical protein